MYYNMPTNSCFGLRDKLDYSILIYHPKVTAENAGDWHYIRKKNTRIYSRDIAEGN